MESEDTRESVQEMPVVRKSFFSRLGGVYFSPRDTFLEIGRAPGLLVPIIVLILFGSFSTYFLMQKVDMQASMRTQLEQAVQDGKLTEEQMNQQLAMVSKFGPATIIFAGISTFIICLVIAGYGRLMGVLTSVENAFKPLLAVTVYAMLAVSIVTTVLLIVILQLRPPGQIELADISSVLASNLGAVLELILGAGAVPKFILGFAQRVDIFNIWIIALLAIGFAAVSKKLKTSTAALWLGVPYALYAVLMGIVASFSGTSGS